MYVWTIDLEEHWSYNEKGAYENVGLEYTIVANDADAAITKAKSMAAGETIKDDDGKIHKRLAVRVISIERGVHVDAVTK